MEQKSFYIVDHGIRLHVTLDLPEQMNGKIPLVILVHGFTGNKEERHILGVRDVWTANGYAVLRVDLYGHGKSDGLFEDHTLELWISNLFAVTDYVKSLDFVSDLYLCGHSQGGLLVILGAGMRPNDYKGIVPLSPALLIPEGARSGSLLGGSFDPVHFSGMIDSGKWKLKSDYIRSAQKIYPKEAILRFDGPVLIVHGSGDQTVPVEDSIEASKQYNNCTLAIIEGDTHCFDYHLEKVQEAIGKWIK